MKLNVLASNLNKIEAYLDRQESTLVEAADKKRVQEMLKKAKEKLKKLQEQLKNIKMKMQKYSKGWHKEAGKQGYFDADVNNDADYSDLYYKQDDKEQEIEEQQDIIREYEKQLKTAK